MLLLDYFADQKAMSDALIKAYRKLKSHVKSSFVLASYVHSQEDLLLLQNSIASIKDTAGGAACVKERY